jgi:hypothetical protein
MAVYNPQKPEPSQSRRKGGMRGLQDVFAPPPSSKRPTLTGTWEEPRLDFNDRMKWEQTVENARRVAVAQGESVPHTLMSVARVVAHIGDVCRISYDAIADKAGIKSEKTVRRCMAWLEEHGLLTWSHTARRHPNGNWCRSVNLYRLITNWCSPLALLARVRRALWRERQNRSGSDNGNSDHGMPKQDIYRTEQVTPERRAEAQEALARRRKAVEEQAKRDAQAKAARFGHLFGAKLA